MYVIWLFICATWLSHMCDMTQSYVRHDSIYHLMVCDVCDMDTHRCMWYGYTQMYVIWIHTAATIGTILMHVNASVVQEDVRLHLRQQLRQSLRYLRVVSYVCVMSRARLSHVACMNASGHKSEWVLARTCIKKSCHMCEWVTLYGPTP